MRSPGFQGHLITYIPDNSNAMTNPAITGARGPFHRNFPTLPVIPG